MSNNSSNPVASALPADSAQLLDRAAGTLWGLAAGDALGMPTQCLSAEQIAAQYGRIGGFVAANDEQPIAPGMPAGSVTDDTEQALLVAELTISGGGSVDVHELAQRLIDWEARMIARGSLDLLGPSTKAALTALQQGVAPEMAGADGSTNGAAMRIAPLGIAHPPGTQLIAAVQRASLVTHNTNIGVSGAVAVAAVISELLSGQQPGAALDSAVRFAEAAESRGNWVPGATVAARFRLFRPIAARVDAADFPDFLARTVGTSVQSQESIVAALLLFERFADDPLLALSTAANAGGDTDTVGAIAGAMLGALHGTAVIPAESRRLLSEVNPTETGVGRIPELAAQLAELRLRAQEQRGEEQRTEEQRTEEQQAESGGAA